MTLVALLMLEIMLSMAPQIAAYPNALMGCPEKCGDIEIPYPFGIGPNCSLPGFEVSCNMSKDGSYAPFLFNNMPLVQISVDHGYAAVNKNITYTCNVSNTTADDWNLSGTPYQMSSNLNMFTATGCDIVASFTFGDETNKSQGGCITMGCFSPENIRNGFCAGSGCCQTGIPRDLDHINYYQVSFQSRDFTKSNQYNSSQCGYVAFGERITTELYKEKSMRVSLNWIIGNKNCKTAQDKNACTSDHSYCDNSRDGSTFPGYLCFCSPGYSGNPYLDGGCVDFSPSRSCRVFMTKKNTTEGEECQLNVPSVIGFIIGLGFGTGISAFLLYFNIVKCLKLLEKRKQEKLRKKFFNQNRGYLLQQRIASDEDATQRMRIFNFEELEKATNKFDEALILGRGGHGEVYKGILSDQRIVAIKRSKIVDQNEIEQFINEVIILSQVNHRNIVKLYGCCLESEVPLLVYEFIPNGTLFNHLHSKPCPLTWKHRLSIALEAARAVAYLHSSASISVLHRDLKSTNILVDDYFTAKVSDFGISRSVQIDQTGITTVIQGTFGYLDPEYFHTGRLTPKSDVYSFGVILVELLTKEKPNSYFTSYEGGSLVAYFTYAMKQNRLFEILDPQIVVNEKRTELVAVANLAEMCIRMRGEKRPTMKEVEAHLEDLWRSNQQVEDYSCTYSYNLMEM